MAKALREKVGKQYTGTRRTRQAVHGECSVELAKWTFPVIVSFSREPCEYESLTHGSNGGYWETYREATRPVPTQWKRTVRQRALYLPSGDVPSGNAPCAYPVTAPTGWSMKPWMSPRLLAAWCNTR
jgi:hypothetical protein